MTLALVLLFLIPFALAVGTLVSHAGDITAWVKSLADFTIPPPPAWVGKLPLVGASVAEGWQKFAAAGQEELRSHITPYAGQLIGWFAGQAGHVGLMFLHFLLIVILSAILYARGELAADGIKKFARRLAGENGVNAVILAGQAVRAVAMGVILTAAVQTVFAGLGLVVARVPGAALLTALCFMLAIVQLGTGPVLLGVTLWLYWTGHPAWGTAMLVWTLFVTSIDNFIRPFLIRRGANLPLLLIFAGVIGGLIAFGIIGLFIGPVLLAVSYKLLAAWVRENREPPNPRPTSPAN
jgi:predicted PurR-regulated permease PerM